MRGTKGVETSQIYGCMEWTVIWKMIPEFTECREWEH